MPLSPEEIETKEFFTNLRGYDRDEVAKFLRQVAGEVRTIQRALDQRALDQQVELGTAAAAEPRPDPYQALGNEVVAILQDASARASAISDAAERGGATIHADAGKVREEAEQLLAEATQQRGEVQELKHQALDLFERAQAEAAALTAAAQAEAEQLVSDARQERQGLLDAVRRVREGLCDVEDMFQLLKSDLDRASGVGGDDPTEEGAPPAGD